MNYTSLFYKPLLFSVFILGMSFSVALHSPDAYAESLELLTPEEANQLQLTDAELHKALPPVIKHRSLSIGPKIDFKAPPTHEGPDGLTLVEMHGNSPLSIHFLQTLAEVDMNSLDVEAQKSLFSVSLTDRLKPYIHGNKLETKEIKIPAGQFNVVIRIADRVGTLTEKVYRFSVSD